MVVVVVGRDEKKYLGIVTVAVFVFVAEDESELRKCCYCHCDYFWSINSWWYCCCYHSCLTVNVNVKLDSNVKH